MLNYFDYTTLGTVRGQSHTEEWFKDMTHQLGIDKLQTGNLKRVRRLLSVSAVARGMTMLIGTAPERFYSVQDELITGGKKVASRV